MSDWDKLRGNEDKTPTTAEPWLQRACIPDATHIRIRVFLEVALRHSFGQRRNRLLHAHTRGVLALEMSRGSREDSAKVRTGLGLTGW